MRFKSIEIENYKCFDSSGEIFFSSGFNFIVGKNNVGKTALLEVLSLRFSERYSRSVLNVPQRDRPLNTTSLVHAKFETSSEELFQETTAQKQIFPLLMPSPDLPYHDNKAVEYLNSKLNQSLVTVLGTWSVSQNTGLSTNISAAPSVELHGAPSNEFLDFFRFWVVNGVKTFIDIVAYRNLSPGCSYAVATLASQIYFFRAERLNIHTCTIVDIDILEANAANLPSVLHRLQSRNPTRWDKYLDAIKLIFPSIKLITVPIANNQAEIHIWNVPATTERDDLAISLSNCGTGIGQVLAMLYVVFTSESPRTIIIDEPNSFLHPGAVKALFLLLQEYPQHQYIASTHSADVLSSVPEANVILLESENNRPTIKSFSSKDAIYARQVLLSLGVSLRDVFGADEIVWVEGPTEEAIFPQLAERKSVKNYKNTKFVAVKNTGDFDTSIKKVKLALEVYTRLSTSDSILPRSVAFIFDREGRTNADIGDIIRASNGKFIFLKRRMVENYLIHESAIVSIFACKLGMSTDSIAALVKPAFIQLAKNAKYFADRNNIPTAFSQAWFDQVHAANLLKDLLYKISDNKQEFRKTTDTVALFEWLLKNDPSRLEPLKTELNCALRR